jgi:hypothetical protein
MKNKIIQLFNKPQIVQNTGVKYSELVEQFLTPFVSEFEDVEYHDDIFEYAINAWNFGNMKLLFPEGEINAMTNVLQKQDLNVVLMNKLIAHKVSHFSEYTNFIVDYELKEIGGETVLSITTQQQDAYLTDMLGKMTAENAQADFEENYIDRTAIIIKPLQPFLDWATNLYPNEIEGIAETRTYLISEDIDDVSAWLTKKFNQIFEFELESWHLNKKEWPQKRNYKMFKEWFQVDISTMIYDFETKPVSKLE